jgi:hypothetical protein
MLGSWRIKNKEILLNKPNLYKSFVCIYFHFGLIQWSVIWQFLRISGSKKQLHPSQLLGAGEDSTFLKH